MAPNVLLVMRVLLHCPYCEELEEYALVVTMIVVGRLYGSGVWEEAEYGRSWPACGYSPP